MQYDVGEQEAAANDLGRNEQGDDESHDPIEFVGVENEDNENESVKLDFFMVLFHRDLNFDYVLFKKFMQFS